MKPGRNDPCPCGSGRKYKHCCARDDAAASPALRVLGHDTRSDMQSRAMHAIKRSIAWEADVAPMSAIIESDPTVRPAVVMLTAGDVILHSEIDPHPPSDAEGVAARIAGAMDTVLARGGAVPSMVQVRHPDVAAQLARMVRQRGVTNVAASPYLPMLDEFAAGLRQHLLGSETRLPAISNPQMWAAWNLAATTVHDLFAAAAAFYVVSPWVLLADSDVLELKMPNGSRWFACVLGNAEEQFGLVLYERLEEYLALAEAPDPMSAFTAAHGVVISLSFNVRADLPKPMRREIAGAGWPVAGPSAYPNVWTLNTIGGGLTETHARDLAMALEVVARFTGEPSRASNASLPAMEESWLDEPSGTTVRYALDPDDAFL